MPRQPFQSTLPARGATARAQTSPAAAKFQSTLPARGATRRRHEDGQAHLISIHAPRTGSDEALEGRKKKGVTFQSTLPARGATPSQSFTILFFLFQSTLPARGATQSETSSSRRRGDFNPRSPHGERRLSIAVVVPVPLFQSTLPVRGATATVPDRSRLTAISIHAPRMGSDRNIAPIDCRTIVISIHAPRTGSDRRKRRRGQRFFHFNPRSPHGERPGEIDAQGNFIAISIHAPRTGSDASWSNRYAPQTLFQSTLPARGATRKRRRKN